jgi:hypothetical protein
LAISSAAQPFAPLFPERFPIYLYRRANKKIVTNSLVILEEKFSRAYIIDSI